MSQRRVEIVERKRVYDGFFKLDVARVHHELFRGGMSAELKREIFVQRQAVAVLPYDPRADRVVLVEQFRAGTIDWAASPGCSRPWPASSTRTARRSRRRRSAR